SNERARNVHFPPASLRRVPALVDTSPPMSKRKSGSGTRADALSLAERESAAKLERDWSLTTKFRGHRAGSRRRKICAFSAVRTISTRLGSCLERHGSRRRSRKLNGRIGSVHQLEQT